MRVLDLLAPSGGLNRVSTCGSSLSVFLNDARREAASCFCLQRASSRACNFNSSRSSPFLRLHNYQHEDNEYVNTPVRIVSQTHKGWTRSLLSLLQKLVSVFVRCPRRTRRNASSSVGSHLIACTGKCGANHLEGDSWV